MLLQSSSPSHCPQPEVAGKQPKKLFTMIEKLIRPSIYSPLFKIYWTLNNYILMEFRTFSEYPKDKLLGI